VLTCKAIIQSLDFLADRAFVHTCNQPKTRLLSLPHLCACAMIAAPRWQPSKPDFAITAREPGMWPEYPR
jgi:hypothetical protein